MCQSGVRARTDGIHRTRLMPSGFKVRNIPELVNLFRLSGTLKIEHNVVLSEPFASLMAVGLVDPHSHDDTSAAEAAAWLRNPTPPTRQRNFIDQWESEPEWQGPPVEDPDDQPTD